jgi:ketosteroid isomerase-like protein
MPNENVELLRRTYEAFGRGDVPAVMESFAEDITWRVPAVLPHGTDANGRQEVGRFFKRLGGMWDDFGLEFGDFVASDDRVCVIGRAQGRLDGAQTGYGFVHCWTVRDGRCTDFEEYVDPAPELLASR